MSQGEPSALPPGTRVAGRFVLERRLRSGPVLDVYRAKPEGSDPRRYEVRLVRAATTPEAAHRVSRDLAVVTELDHPAVSKVVAVDLDPAGLVVVTQGPEVGVTWETLREVLAAGDRMSIEEVARVVRAVGSALDALHRAPTPVLHRAVCPDNITLVDRRMGVRLEESGLAQALVIAGVLNPRQASVARMYLSPDELLQRPSVRADAFSMASVVYEMLVGRPAFRAVSDAATETALLRGQRPSVLALRDDLPTAVDGVLAQAWAGDASGGFDSVSTFVNVLLEALEAPETIPPAAGQPRRSPSGVAAQRANPSTLLTGSVPPPPSTATPSAVPRAARAPERSQPPPPLPDSKAPAARGGTVVGAKLPAEREPSTSPQRAPTQRVVVPRVLAPGTEKVTPPTTESPSRTPTGSHPVARRESEAGRSRTGTFIGVSGPSAVPVMIGKVGEEARRVEAPSGGVVESMALRAPARDASQPSIRLPPSDTSMSPLRGRSEISQPGVRPPSTEGSIPPASPSSPPTRPDPLRPAPPQRPSTPNPNAQGTPSTPPTSPSVPPSAPPPLPPGLRVSRPPTPPLPAIVEPEPELILDPEPEGPEIRSALTPTPAEPKPNRPAATLLGLMGPLEAPPRASKPQPRPAAEPPELPPPEPSDEIIEFAPTLTLPQVVPSSVSPKPLPSPAEPAPVTAPPPGDIPSGRPLSEPPALELSPETEELHIPPALPPSDSAQYVVVARSIPPMMPAPPPIAAVELRNIEGSHPSIPLPPVDIVPVSPAAMAPPMPPLDLPPVAPAPMDTAAVSSPTLDAPGVLPAPEARPRAIPRRVGHATQPPPPDDRERRDALVVRIAKIMGGALVLSAVVLTAGQIYLAQRPPAPPPQQPPRVVVAPPQPPVVAVRDPAQTPPRAPPVLAPSASADAAAAPTAEVDAGAAGAPQAAAVDAGLPQTASADVPAAEAPPGAPGDEPLERHPRVHMMNRAQRRMAPAVEACIAATGRSRRARVSVVYASTGAITELRVHSPYNEPPASTCIERVVRAEPMTRFTDESWDWVYVFGERD